MGAYRDLSASPQRRFECVIIDWAALADHDGDLTEIKELVEACCAGGMDLALVTHDRVEATDTRLRARPQGPGRFFLCASRSVYRADGDGLRLVHRGDAGQPHGAAPQALRWLLADLWARGVGPDSVFTIAPQRHGPDARTAVRQVLADQLRRRRDVPLARAAPDWSLVVDGRDQPLTRVHESLLTLADGRLGTRGSPVIGDGTTTPAVFMAGVYDGHGPDSHLAPLPLWATLAQPQPGQPRPSRQRLDLRAGTLQDEGAVTAVRFSSLARPGTVVLRASAPPQLLPAPGRRAEPGVVSMAVRDRRDGDVLDRLGAYDPDPGVAQAALAEAERAGFERLLREHREAWARRWQHADVIVEGDDALQRQIRFALFHLIASVGEGGEAAVGARGLSGPAYLGHVFWDSDIFVLPFLAATHPAAARAMLEYRVRRLPAARAAARMLGLAGARFPWESAAEGVDVTPGLARLPTGEDLVIRTGDLEEHIVADVAWAVACYLDWSGDTAFATGAGATLLVETARYWASRIRLDRDGRGHIDRVMGPDEYHQPVDDNAFTNVMARWNLRQAAAVAGAPPEEATHWSALADAIVDGYDERTGRYEQFAGFFDLEPLVIADELPHGRRRPIAAEVLLGVRRTARAQVVKQADVLMLHHLVPEETAPGSLATNLDFYEPRTAHGSSLSPAIHASLLARAGRVDQALSWLRVAARMDLDDLSATTAGGLHLATMGGLWQALAYGFAGLRVRADRLLVRPHLPPAWRALELNLRFRGAPVRLRLEPHPARVQSDTADIRRVGDDWEVMPQ